MLNLGMSYRMRLYPLSAFLRHSPYQRLQCTQAVSYVLYLGLGNLVSAIYCTGIGRMLFSLISWSVSEQIRDNHFHNFPSVRCENGCCDPSDAGYRRFPYDPNPVSC